MVKIYETINDVRLVTSVEVDGRCHVITFAGGGSSPQWRAAQFVCEDELLQQAIESSSSYGVSYILKESPSGEPLGVPSGDVALVNVEEVTSKQAAIEWFRINLDMRFSPTVSSVILIETAAEKGYLFLNWEQNGK